MHRLFMSFFVVIVTVAGVFSSAEASAPAQIVANPNSVMVNTATKLTGTNFASSKRITIEECSSTLWYVLGNPCVTSVKVKTNSQGQFKAIFTVHACATTAEPGFAATCYIGEPAPYGVDTIRLTGATSITVTGP